ncbi:MAG: hypothetical protein AYK18_18425 [Theionarchaea archaeon DG-70]|nr:MAG: hypothetical protein AYK18_18425 [Theionarchaea archaeon DG-70]
MTEKQPVKKKKKTSKEELIEELTDMIKDIDEDGLIFLIKQANVLLYNKRVEEINLKIERSVSERKGRGKVQQTEDYSVDIEESGDGQFFYIILNYNRIFFTLDESKSPFLANLYDKVTHTYKVKETDFKSKWNTLVDSRLFFP